MTRRSAYAQARLAGLCTRCSAPSAKRWACLKCRAKGKERRQALRRRVAVSLADLRAKPREVTQLAKRDGGVSVVDADGVHVFRLWIPNKAIP